MTKKKWGQNFLINPNVIESIIKVAKVKIGDEILEIGPGSGNLTQALLKKQSFVKAIEIDRKWCKYLTNRFKKEKKFTLIEMDVMDIPLITFSRLVSAPSKMIANLPYNIATPLLLKMLPIRKTWDSLTLMVQKEVAERICAKPNSGKTFGALSLVGELGFDREIISIIKPNNFCPEPKVDSAIINLFPRDSGLSPEREKLFLKWSQLLFQQRRKTLTNGIRQHFPNWYQNSGHSIKKKFGMNRPENIEFEDWMKLFKNYLKNDKFKTV